MSTITNIKSRRVWDSRGHPTVEVEVGLENGITGRAIAPAGASRGAREAIDLRDGGDTLQGKDVKQAIRSVEEIIVPALLGQDINQQQVIDEIILGLDPSPMKSQLGGNATVAVSLATIHAAAANAKKPLWRHIADHYDCSARIPLPEIQIFGGGAHAAERVDIQDFMIMVPGASSFNEVMEVTNEVYFAAGDIPASRNAGMQPSPVSLPCASHR